MQQQLSLIFDIGKTNKKWFLMNEQLELVASDSVQFDEIEDDEGYPCDDLMNIIAWIQGSIEKLFNHASYNIQTINFSAYGASLVHLDKHNKPLLPFYNYTKALPFDFYKHFFDKIADKAAFSRQTASPLLGMLNAGLQLFYLKTYKPEFYEKVHTSLHLPQFLSFCLTQKKVADYTSIGCHTALWDFEKMDYHAWVYRENIQHKLPPISNSTDAFDVMVHGKKIKVGIGIHDSSAALVAYKKQYQKPFCLLSTGTWNIAMNPHNHSVIQPQEFNCDCLSFLDPEGKSVKACRLFMGKELATQIQRLNAFFNKVPDYYKGVVYRPNLVLDASESSPLQFDYSFLQPQRFGFSTAALKLNNFKTFEQAYHQLLHELTDIQIASLRLIMDLQQEQELIIEGGFAQNNVFVNMLQHKLEKTTIRTANLQNGPAAGALMVMR